MRRPFRGLRRAPDERYDAIVVGAGIGGLVAANLLAREGLAVLLVEQHYMTGGYCSSFRRAGFTFDASTHFYPLLGNRSTFTGKLLADLGVEVEWVKMDPVDTFHFPDGTRFEVAAELEGYLDDVKTAFPHQATELDRFFAAAREAYSCGLLAYFRGRETPRFEELRRLTVRQVLDRTVGDPKLKLLLTADCPHWGSPPERTSFVFDSMLRLSYFLGNYYPREGSQAFVDELARRFEEQGGHLLMSTRVEAIELADGAVAGVELATLRGPRSGRHRVGAHVVVSNADLKLTLGRLLPDGAVDPELIARLDRLRPTYPCYLTHLGLDGVAVDDLDRVQGYYWSGWDPDRVGRDSLICKVFSPSVYSPRLAPPGGQVVILQKVLDLEHVKAERGTAFDPDEHKREIEAFLRAHFAEVLPGVEENVVVATTASARTAERFTLNTAGAMLGWEMSPDQLGPARPSIEGPVPGLFFVGHWTRPGGGVTPVIVSALQAVEAVTGSTLIRSAAPAERRAPVPAGAS